MDRKILAAITAAVEAYIETEKIDKRIRFGQRLNPWKMAARRETVSRRSLISRVSPSKIRLRRFSLF